MLEFHSISMEDRQRFMQCAAQHNDRLCEHCFTDLFIWKDHYDTQVCFFDGFVLVKSATWPDKRPTYLAPVGKGDIKAAVEVLMQDAAERGIPFVMHGASERGMAEIEAAMPDVFQWTEVRDSADYIYLSQRMISLAGKKLQSKRNYVNRFHREHDGHWTYEVMDHDNMKDAFAFHLKWEERNGRGGGSEADSSGETKAITLLMDHFDELGLRGGIIRIDGNIVAFSMGCPMSEDTFDIQIEKADADISGAYAIINQEFARRNCADYTYINREDDLGLEGLRRAKLSYRPEMLAKKFTAVRKDDSIC